jgi:tRNA(Ile)-lysidine synthase TilS/MesJ
MDLPTQNNEITLSQLATIIENNTKELRTEMAAGFKQARAETEDLAIMVNNGFKEMRTDLNEFKAEMNEFKEEMYEFRDEMYSFRDEMYEFKKETRAEFKELKNISRSQSVKIEHHNERLNTVEKKLQIA